VDFVILIIVVFVMIAAAQVATETLGSYFQRARDYFKR